MARKKVWKATIRVTLRDLLRDTASTHGHNFAASHARECGIPLWETLSLLGFKPRSFNTAPKGWDLV